MVARPFCPASGLPFDPRPGFSTVANRTVLSWLSVPASKTTRDFLMQQTGDVSEATAISRQMH